MRRENQIWVVIGKKGFGKTSFLRSMVLRLPRVVILDAMGHDFGGGTVVEDVESLAVYYNRVKDLSAFCIIVRPRDASMERAFFRLAMRARDTWFVVDEADKYCNPSGWKHPEFRELVNYGRHLPNSLIVASRRPQALHGDCLANHDVLVVHRTQGRQELKALSDWIDVDGLRELPPLAWRAYGSSPYLPAPATVPSG